MVIIVALDLLMDTLTGMIRGVLTNIDVEALSNVDFKVFTGVMTAFKFVMS